MRHMSHHVTVAAASTSSTNMNVSMVIRPSITSTNSSSNNKMLTTTDEIPLDLTLRKSNQKFAEKRNQENENSGKVKRSRTDNSGHLLNQIINDVAATTTTTTTTSTTGIATSPAIVPFSTSNNPSTYLLRKEMNWMLEESASMKCFTNGGRDATTIATTTTTAAAAGATAAVVASANVNNANVNVNNGSSATGFHLARLLLAQLQAHRDASSMLS
ncbi:hypothetical protein LOAG_18924 [Loa loa]|nr:hypothetical protein LOAG_18924 [Loa loa]EJD73663.1 hypothetical protein LOAG_18924 [Loa loa]